MSEEDVLSVLWIAPERLFRHREFQNQAEVKMAMEDYIERYYNWQRLHLAFGYCSPEEFEQQESGT